VKLEKRVKNIFKNLDSSPDIILLKNSSEPFIDNNFFYVSGLNKGLFEGSTAILFPDGVVELLVSELESEAASKAGVNVNVYKTGVEFDNVLRGLVSSYKNVGLNFKGISHRDFCKLKDKFPKTSFVDVSESFAKTRCVKDELEIKNINEACKIVDKVLVKIPGVLREGMYEYELAAEIDYLMQKNGAEKAAFETISSFGVNTSEPHYSHGDTKLKPGDFVLCDFGAHYLKYNSDITRTFVFGNASEKQKEMYNTVLEAQKIGFETAKPGVKACVVHAAVNSYIDSTKFKGCFIHTTGHSLGLAVHDPGIGFSSVYDVELEENMVLTIEPGVYIPGFGGVRIEDDVLIKRDGIEILTKTSRELLEL